MTLSISGCGCVSDPITKVHAPCVRPNHELAYGYERGFVLPCTDCQRELLYPSWMGAHDITEPCCARCISIRFERENARNDALALDAYYERVASNIRTLSRVRHEPAIEVVDLAFACTDIGAADVDPLSDPSPWENLHVIRRAVRLSRET